MKWRTLEPETKTIHDRDDGLTRLDLGSEVGYVLLSALLLELGLF